MDILKVSAQSDSSATAGALANTVRQNGEAELQGIGPKAVNQAVKAIAIARSYLASSGVDLIAVPSFVDVEIDGEPRTAMRFSVKPRHRTGELQPREEERERESLEEQGETPESEEPEEALAGEGEGEEPHREPRSLSEAIAGRPAEEEESAEEPPMEEAPHRGDFPEPDLDKDSGSP